MTRGFPMPPDRWMRVKDLFHAALARPADERTAFLAERTGDDHALREAVQSMLARESEFDRFLESPALQVEAMQIAADLRGSGSAAVESGPPPLPADLRAIDAARACALPPPSRASGRPPWWIVLLAAIFLADALLRAWCWTAGPEGLGGTTRLQHGRAVVTAVLAGGLAERAGIRPGDVILSVPVQPNLEVGRPCRIEFERDGQRRSAQAIPGRRLRAMLFPRVSAHVIWQLAMLAMLPPAFLIAFTRPREPLARLGALTLASLAISLYGFNLPPGYAVAVRALPFQLGALALVPNLAVALAGATGLTFFLRFPRPLFRARWPWILVWLPALVGLPAYTRAMVVVFGPEHLALAPVREWLHVQPWTVFGAYGVAMVAAISLPVGSISGVCRLRAPPCPSPCPAGTPC